MEKKTIQLTEQDLHMLVENTVRILIKENGMEEGVWGGMKNAYNGIKSGNFNIGQTYNSGKISSNFSNFANQAMTAINEMIKIANSTGNQQISRYLTQVNKTIGNSVNSFNAASQEVAQGNALYNQNNNAFKFDNKQINKMGFNKMYNKTKPQNTKNPTT